MAGVWQSGFAVVGIVLAIGWPLRQQAAKRSAESIAAAFIQQLAESQDRFRRVYGGFATELASLTETCDGQAQWLDRHLLARLGEHDYEVVVRPTADARPLAADCRGRATASDYYAAVTPVAGRGLAQRAYARRGTGDVAVFFDRVAPQERDFPPGGLAAPLQQLDAFTIP